MTNTEVFRAVFNDIEHYLKDKYRFSDNTGFQAMVDACESRDQIVRRFSSSLKKYARLRNVVVHENDVIADVSEKVTQSMKMIYEALVDPPGVSDFIHEVATCQLSDTLLSVLLTVRAKDFSQFPAYNGGLFQGLVTENGITRWLARHAEDDLFSTAETSISDILGCEESNDNVRFVARSASAYEAAARFTSADSPGNKHVEAVIITEHGKPSERPIGILTTWDVLHHPVFQLPEVQ